MYLPRFHFKTLVNAKYFLKEVWMHCMQCFGCFCHFQITMQQPTTVSFLTKPQYTSILATSRSHVIFPSSLSLVLLRYSLFTFQRHLDPSCETRCWTELEKIIAWFLVAIVKNISRNCWTYAFYQVCPILLKYKTETIGG